jgi:DNA-binding MarR family transcriptional regulator
MSRFTAETFTESFVITYPGMDTKQTSHPKEEVRQDFIDMILDRWARERPDLDVSPMGVIGRISRACRVLEEEMSNIFSAYGLNRGEFDVLAALRRAGKPYRLKPTELSSDLMVTSGGMTNRLDRMEKSGLIVRQPDPTDRRGVLVCLSEHGRRLVDEILVAYVENQHRLLGSIDQADRDALANILRKLLLPLERRI